MSPTEKWSAILFFRSKDPFFSLRQNRKFKIPRPLRWTGERQSGEHGKQIKSERTPTGVARPRASAGSLYAHIFISRIPSRRLHSWHSNQVNPLFSKTIREKHAERQQEPRAVPGRSCSAAPLARLQFSVDLETHSKGWLLPSPSQSNTRHARTPKAARMQVTGEKRRTSRSSRANQGA